MGSALLQSSAEKLAKEMLDKYGGIAIYTVVISESTDQSTGATIPATSTPHTVSALPTKATTSELSSGSVSHTQKVFLMYANAIPSEPDSTDLFEMNGTVLKVVKALESSGGQSAVLYRLVCEV